MFLSRLARNSSLELLMGPPGPATTEKIEARAVRAVQKFWLGRTCIAVWRGRGCNLDLGQYHRPLLLRVVVLFRAAVRARAVLVSVPLVAPVRFCWFLGSCASFAFLEAEIAAPIIAIKPMIPMIAMTTATKMSMPLLSPQNQLQLDEPESWFPCPIEAMIAPAAAEMLSMPRVWWWMGTIGK